MNDISNESINGKSAEADHTEKGLLAVMMGTHNHPSVIREILELSAADYRDLGIDIYYYDSSESDETRTIVEEYIDKGFDNLFYVPCQGMELHGKLDCFFRGEGLKMHYKYLWPSKDRCSYKRPLLNEIMDELTKDYDALFLIDSPGEKVEYDSALEFYRDWATWVTSVNTTIYSTKRLITDLPAKCANSSLNEYDYMFQFKHYYYFFYRLAQIDAPRIKVLDSANYINMLYVPKTNLLQLVRIWKETWIDANEALPDLYDPFKDYVIKVPASVPWGLADRNRLLEYQKSGILNEENLPLFLNEWERISDIPKDVVVKIAKGTYDIKYDLSQVQGYDQLIDNLCGFAFLLRAGLLETAKFPFAMVEVSINTIKEQKATEDALEELKVETVELIWQEIDRRDMNAEDLANHLQQIVAILI